VEELTELLDRLTRLETVIGELQYQLAVIQQERRNEQASAKAAHAREDAPKSKTASADGSAGVESVSEDRALDAKPLYSGGRDTDDRMIDDYFLPLLTADVRWPGVCSRFRCCVSALDAAFIWRCLPAWHMVQFNSSIVSTVFLHARLAGAGKSAGKRGQPNTGILHPLLATATRAGKLVISDGKTGDVLDEISSPVAPTLRLPAETAAALSACGNSAAYPAYISHDPSDGA
jgi:hypothetical protein